MWVDSQQISVGLSNDLTQWCSGFLHGGLDLVGVFHPAPGMDVTGPQLAMWMGGSPAPSGREGGMAVYGGHRGYGPPLIQVCGAEGE